MQDKLQELTAKLFNEGLSKGKEEGEALLAKAKTEAAEIVADARKKAETIVAKAQKDAEDLRSKAEGDVKMAASQSLQATKKDIEGLIISKLTDSDVKDALSSADFVKQVILAVAQKFNADEATDVELLLPESLKSALEPFVQNELAAALKGGVNASFSKKVAGGFTIGPKDGGYFIDFTDESFKSLISEYLRPVTRKILFGE